MIVSKKPEMMSLENAVTLIQLTALVHLPFASNL